MANHETTIQTLEQGRAKYAYECVKEVLEAKKDKQKEYKSHVKKLPAYIQTNGLGATVAFIYKKECMQIYEHIEGWLKEDEKKLIDLSENKKLVEEIVKVDSSVYRAVTNEVLALLNWLRRFADGLIKDK